MAIALVPDWPFRKRDEQTKKAFNYVLPYDMCSPSSTFGKISEDLATVLRIPHFFQILSSFANRNSY